MWITISSQAHHSQILQFVNQEIRNQIHSSIHNEILQWPAIASDHNKL